MQPQAASNPLLDPDCLIEPPEHIIPCLSQVPVYVPTRKTQEEMVVLFLRELNIEVDLPPANPPRPPKRSGGPNRGADALAGAFYGAFGPGAVAAGTHLRNQERSLALAEEANQWAQYNAALTHYNEKVRQWESWQQWALAHPDWTAFADEIEDDFQQAIQDAEAHNRGVEEWYYSGDGQQEIRSILLAEKREAKQRKAQADRERLDTRLGIGLIIFLLVLCGGLLSLLILLTPQATTPKQPQTAAPSL